MVSGKAISALAGLVVLAVGVAGALGYVPGLSVVCTYNCNGNVTPNFSYASNGLEVKLTDTSTEIKSNAGWVGLVSIGWGDGTNSSNVTPPFGTYLPYGNFSHTYSSAGNYSVTILLVMHPPPPVGSFDVRGEGTVSVGGSCSASCVGASVKASFDSSIVDASATVVDTSVASGGAQITSLSVEWGDTTSSSASSPGATFTHTYSAAGSYEVTEDVYWEVGGSGTEYFSAATTNLTVVLPLAATITGTSSDPVGTSDVFTVSVTGGLAPFTYAFFPTGYAGTQSGPTYTITGGQAGSGSINANVVDSNGKTVTTNTFDFTFVNGTGASDLKASVTGPSTLVVGTEYTFTAVATGGTAPYQYTFYATGISGSSEGPSYTVTPTSAGSGTISVLVTDSANRTVSSQAVNFVVQNGGPSCGISGKPACPSSSPTVSFNAFNALLIGVGFSLLLLPFVPISVVIRVGLGGVIIAVLTVAGWFVGGPGLL
jgi:hypothetical protein